MTCKSCDEKNKRYGTDPAFTERNPLMTTKPQLSRMEAERLRELEADKKLTGSTPAVDDAPTKMSKMTYEELVKSRVSMQENMRTNTLTNLKNMSDAMKRAYFEELIQIANCEGFTPMGISPDQALVELVKALDIEEFSGVIALYPEACFKIKERYNNLIKNKIPLR